MLIKWFKKQKIPVEKHPSFELYYFTYPKGNQFVFKLRISKYSSSYDNFTLDEIKDIDLLKTQHYENKWMVIVTDQLPGMYWIRYQDVLNCIQRYNNDKIPFRVIPREKTIHVNWDDSIGKICHQNLAQGDRILIEIRDLHKMVEFYHSSKFKQIKLLWRDYKSGIITPSVFLYRSFRALFLGFTKPAIDLLPIFF
jgi:hypothetical protein